MMSIASISSRTRMMSRVAHERTNSPEPISNPIMLMQTSWTNRNTTSKAVALILGVSNLHAQHINATNGNIHIMYWVENTLFVRTNVVHTSIAIADSFTVSNPPLSRSMALMQKTDAKATAIRQTATQYGDNASVMGPITSCV